MVKNIPITSQRLKMLRISHDLRTVDLGSMLNMTYRNYLKYENGTLSIDCERLKFLASYYAVSANWILGLSETKYELNMIQKIEKQLFVKDDHGQFYIECDITEGDTPKSIKVFPSNDYIIHPLYQNVNSRNLYTLPVRANIIFICHWIQDFFIDNPAFATKLDLSFFKLNSDMIDFLVKIKFIIKDKDLPWYFSKKNSDSKTSDRNQSIHEYVSRYFSKDLLIPLYRIDSTQADTDTSLE